MAKYFIVSHELAKTLKSSMSSIKKTGTTGDVKLSVLTSKLNKGLIS